MTTAKSKSPAPSKITAVTDADFKSTVDGGGLVLVDFWATWCGPCKAMVPVLEDVAGRYPALKIVKLDVDLSEETTKRLRIQSIPTLILFKDGASVWRHVGGCTAKKIENAIARANGS